MTTPRVMVKLFLGVAMPASSLLFSSRLQAAPPGTVAQITSWSDTSDNTAPSLDDGQIAWTKSGSDGHSSVYWFDGDQIHRISTGTYAFLPSLSKGQVAWGEALLEPGKDYGDGRPHVFFYDGTHPVYQLENSGTENGHPESLILRNGQIVWTNSSSEGDFGHWYLFDGGETTVLPDNICSGSQNSGSLLFAFSQICPLTGDPRDENLSSDNGQQAFERYNPQSQVFQVFFFDGTQTIQLTTGAYDSFYPSLNGGQVAWEGWDGQYWQIYLYNGKETLQLTKDTFDHHAPSVSKGKVAWYAAPPGQTNQIFLWSPAPLPRPLTASNVGDGERIRLKWMDVSPAGKKYEYNVWRKEETEDESAWVKVSMQPLAATHGTGEWVDGPSSSNAPVRGVIYDYKVEVTTEPGVSSSTALGPMKGVAEPFVMMVRGYGGDDQTYWDQYRTRLTVTQAGPGKLFRSTPTVDGSNYSKPQTFWDTADLQHQEVYPDGQDHRIGQLDPWDTGSALFKELGLWLNEARKSNRTDSVGRTILDWTPETFSIISHSLGGPISRSLTQLIDEYQDTWKKSGSYPAEYIPTVKKNVMLSPANQGSSTAWTLQHTPEGKVLSFVEWASEKRKSWPATTFLSPDNTAKFNCDTPPNDTTQYDIMSGNEVYAGGFGGIGFHALKNFLGYVYTSWTLHNAEADSLAPDMLNDGAVTVSMQQGTLTNKVRTKLHTQYGFTGPWEESEFHPDPKRLQISAVPLNHFYGMVKCDAMPENTWRSVDLPPRPGAADPDVRACSGQLPVDFEDTRNLGLQKTDGGTLFPGGQKSETVSVPQAHRWAAAAAWNGPDGAVSVVLRTPDGVTIDGASGQLPANVRYQSDGAATLYIVDNPQSGDWTMTLRGAAAPAEGVDYASLQLMDSSQHLDVLADVGSVAPETSVPLLAQVMDVDSPVGDATVSAVVKLQNGTAQTVPLEDDGTHGDGAAGDGVYGASYTAPSSTGPVSVRYTARTSGGIQLAANGGFDVVDRQTLTVDQVLAERPIHDGTKLAELDVDVQGSFSGHNPFVLRADLVDPSGSLVARGRADVRGDPGSTVTTTLIFKGEDIAASGLNGPYTVKHFFMFQPGGADYVFNDDLTYQTQPYTADQFPLLDTDGDGLPDVVEARLGTDPTMKDTDGDGLTDYEEVARDGDPSTYTPGVDTDPLNPDTDGDGHIDGLDAFPLDPRKWSDQNNPPMAVAGPDGAFEATSSTGADVALDGRGSSDPDNDPLTYSWSWAGGSAVGSTPTVHLPLGVSTITLTVTDNQALSASSVVMITVRDTTPPAIINKCEILSAANGVYRVNWDVRDIVDSAPVNAGVVLFPSLNGFQIIQVSSPAITMSVDLTQKKATITAPDPAALQAAITQAGGLPVTKGQTVQVLSPVRQDLFSYTLQNNVLTVQASHPALKLTARDASGNSAAMTITAP